MNEPRLRTTDASEAMVERARELRAAQTFAETVLWAQLRGRGLDGLKFRRQCPLGSYVVDFLCAERFLAIEIDGDYHDDDDQRIIDHARTRFLEDYGYRVLRFRNDAVLFEIGSVLEAIRSEALTPESLPQEIGESKRSSGRRTVGNSIGPEVEGAAN